MVDETFPRFFSNIPAVQRESSGRKIVRKILENNKMFQKVAVRKLKKKNLNDWTVNLNGVTEDMVVDLNMDDTCVADVIKKQQLFYGISYKTWPIRSYRTRLVDAYTRDPHTEADNVNIMPRKQALLNCSRCDNIFHTAFMLEGHMEQHRLADLVKLEAAARYMERCTIENNAKLEIELFACEECDNEFGNKEELKYHKRVSHKSREPNTKSRTSLNQHQTEKHSGRKGSKVERISTSDVRPFSCRICRETFKKLKNLLIHKTLHISATTKVRMQMPPLQPIIKV